jgi:ribosome recycling factor
MQLYEKMDVMLESLHRNLNKIQVVATESLIDSVKVDAYDSIHKLSTLCKIEKVDSSTVEVTPFDRSIRNVIGHALNSANLGVNVQIGADKIRIAFPESSYERREQLSAQCKDLCETAKIGIRKIRQDANAEVKKSTTDKDSIKSELTEIQNMTDLYINKINEIYKEKDIDLLGWWGKHRINMKKTGNPYGRI